MTAKKDLKRHVRERQERTGESYMTALRHVLDQRPRGVPVIEMIDISEIAAALGIKCRVKLSPTLADRIDAASVLRRLNAALGATLDDPAFALMRSVLLHGAAPIVKLIDFDAAQRFMLRVRAGIGGISDHGRLLALTVDGRRGAEMIVFALWLSPVTYVRYPPSLFVTSIDAVHGDPGEIALLWR